MVAPLPCSDLIVVGEALFGPHWKVDVSRHLGITYRTLMRWLASDADLAPEHVAVLRLLVRSRLAALEDARKLLWSKRF